MDECPYFNVLVPGNPGTFFPSDFIKPGMPGFQGVGPKLAELLEGQSVSVVRPRIVLFYRPGGSVIDPYPSIPGGFEPVINWWTLYQFLVWPTDELVEGLPAGTQLAALINFGGVGAVRVKIDWQNGHSIGGRPSTEGWTWSAETVYTVLASD